MRGNEYCIHVLELANDSIIELSDKLHDKLRNLISKAEINHGFDLSKEGGHFNNYDNDEYLFLASFIRKRMLFYETMYRDEQGNWLEGCSQLPYIHLELVESNSLDLDEFGTPVINDKKLILQVSPPDENGNYTLKFDRFFLHQYIHYLQRIFDKNKELTMSSDEEVFKKSLESVRFVGFDKLLEIANNFFKSGFTELGFSILDKAKKLKDGETIPEPMPLFFKNTIDGQSTFYGFASYDKERELITLPLKKTIFNTSGFSDYFEERNNLIQYLFEKTVEMIINHEIAHVACGHFKLQANDYDYAREKYVSIALEQNADDTAIRWLLGSTLYETLDNNPYSLSLSRSKSDIVEEWSFIIFAAYLTVSWIYRDNERVWNTDTLDDYLDDPDITHPIYQFRTFNIVNRGLNLVMEFAKSKANNGVGFITSDEITIDERIGKQVVDKVIDMINSFEYSFQRTYYDIRDIHEMAKDSWRIQHQTIPENAESIPLLFPVVYADAMDEINKLHDIWPDIRKRLVESGAYFSLFKTN